MLKNCELVDRRPFIRHYTTEEKSAVGWRKQSSFLFEEFRRVLYFWAQTLLNVYSPNKLKEYNLVLFC